MSKKIMTIRIEIDMDSKRAKEWKYPGQYFDDEVDDILEAISNSGWNNLSRRYDKEYYSDSGNKAKVSVRSEKMLNSEQEAHGSVATMLNSNSDDDKINKS